MRPSRLLARILNLPPESAFIRAIAPQAAWTPGEYLLAMAVDQLAAANYQRGGGRGTRPDPVPRPGGAPPGEVEVIHTDTFDTLEDFMAWRETQLSDE